MISRQRAGTVAGAQLLFVAALAALLATACDDAFSPIRHSELRYSVFGYLDVSADTQWVRVMPIRPVVLTSKAQFDGTATLERIGSGRVVELRDSVFAYEPFDPGVGGEPFFLHNLWTPERVEPGITYRFVVARPGEQSAEAIVETPADYQAEVWDGQPGTFGFDQLRVHGVNYIAGVAVRGYGCEEGVSRVVLRGVRREGDTLVVTLDRSTESWCDPNVVWKWEIWVAGSAAPWPTAGQFEPWRLGVSDIPSNVSNAVGYLGGILSKTLPYERCEFVERPPPARHCQLRYTEASVTLRGGINDSECGGGVGAATVELLEVGPAIPHKRRWTISSPAGSYEIGALEGGRRYALSARRLTLAHERPDSVPHYTEYTDTLEFAPGEQRQLNLVLRRLQSCGTP